MIRPADRERQFTPDFGRRFQQARGDATAKTSRDGGDPRGRDSAAFPTSLPTPNLRSSCRGNRKGEQHVCHTHVKTIQPYRHNRDDGA